MRVPPTLLATIAILLSACGTGEAEVNGSPIVAPTTTTTTTIAVPTADEGVPDELAQADPADAEPVTSEPEPAAETTTTTTSAPAATAAPTTAPPTTTPSDTATFCAELGRLAAGNPHQTGIEGNANTYANYIRWEIDELEQVDAPAAVAADFAAYLEAERRTLAWVAANGAALNDVRSLDDVNTTIGLDDLADGISRYFGFLRSECPQF